MAVTRVLDELAEFDGVSAKVEISVSRQRNRSLNLERVWDVIRGYQNRRDDFESLSVKGPVEDPELGPHLETIDFVAEHLKQIDEDVTETDRGLNPESCRMALRRSLRIHRDYLREYRE